MNALMDSIAPRDSFEVRYRPRAKYPIRAQGLASRVYEYYDPNERPPASFSSLNAASLLTHVGLRPVSASNSGLNFSYAKTPKTNRDTESPPETQGLETNRSFLGATLSRLFGGGRRRACQLIAPPLSYWYYQSNNVTNYIPCASATV
jgi:hypothetical protein